MTPLSAAVINDSVFKKSIDHHWSKITTNAIDFTVNSLPQTGNSTVSIFDTALNELLPPPTITVSHSNFPLSLTGTYSSRNDSGLITNWKNPTELLWPTCKVCNDVFYEKMSLTKPDNYFIPRLLTPKKSMTFHLWKLLGHHEKWGLVLNENINPFIEPEPTLVALLGASIVGLATFKRRKKMHNNK
jgi:hypothetical protein